jgi:hypothetical protein
MRSILFVLFFGSGAFLLARGDDPLTVLKNNYLQMRDVNVTVEATTISELTPYFAETYPSQAQGEMKWQEHLFFCADKTGFDVEETRPGDREGIQSFSYDGTTYEARLPDKMLRISKNYPAAPPAVWNFNALLFPVAALAESHDDQDQIDCLWSEVMSPDFWKTAAGFSPDKNGSLRGVVKGDAIIITLPKDGSPLGITGFESYRGTSGLLLKKYVCMETATVAFQDAGQKRTFAYPKKAILQLFDEKGKLVRNDMLTIDKISVNDPNFKESRFTVDPASMAHIYDSDAKKFIK